MTILTVDEIILLHEKLIQKTGGSAGLRDFGLLESAVYSAEGAFGDMEIYPTIPEKLPVWHMHSQSIMLLWTVTSGLAYWLC